MNQSLKTRKFVPFLILPAFLLLFSGCEDPEPEKPDCSLEISQAWDQAHERMDSLHAVIESLEARVEELSRESAAREDSLRKEIKRLKKRPPVPKPDGGPTRTNTGNRIN